MSKFKLKVNQSFSKSKIWWCIKCSLQEAIERYPEIIRETLKILVAMTVTKEDVERLISAFKIIKFDLKANLEDNEYI